MKRLIFFLATIALSCSAASAQVSGTTTTTTNATGNCIDPQCFLVSSVIQDSVNAGSSSQPFVGWYWHHILGSSTAKGRITGLFEEGIDTTPTSPGNDYVALEAFAHASVNLGTASLFAWNPVAQISGTATVAQLVVDEHDGRALAGATYNDFIMQQNVILGTHAQNGSRMNVSYVSASQSKTTPMFDAIFQDGAYSGYPSSSTNTTVFRCFPHANAGSCPSIANGIDLRKYAAISGAAFASPGFAVDGSGNVTGNSYKAGSVQGVSCSGAPTAGFAVTNGIVTHC